MPVKYHIWTEGCQMNAADSQRVASALEVLGYQHTATPEQADVVVLNTCVVRESAEQKAVGRLTSLKLLKTERPDVVINLMGCMVGAHQDDSLRKRFPYVDVFSPPSDPRPLVEFLGGTARAHMEINRAEAEKAVEAGWELPLPGRMRGSATAFLPAVLGCSHACAYCIIPLKRGREESRPPQQILAEAAKLASQGVKEITVLGQIIDRYGLDQPGYPSLAALLRQLHAIEGIQRIRFLTSHPNWFSDELLGALAELPKLMPHIELPVQAGSDRVLTAMRRGYTAEQFVKLVEKIRARLGEIAFATDLIVGFPGETEKDFEQSLQVLRVTHPDMTHAARYSPRPGTLSARSMADDVPENEKWRRFREVERLQETISTEINSANLGRVVPVLFEGKSKARWFGRTPTNKLVFAESQQDPRGSILEVKINWTGPWSLVGNLVQDEEVNR